MASLSLAVAFGTVTFVAFPEATRIRPNWPRDASRSLRQSATAALWFSGPVDALG